jgi:hypothetical protein
MFNLFGRKTAKDFEAEAKETYGVPTVAPVEVPKRDQVVYKIGKTEDGKVTLSLGDYSGVTITMNNAGVDHLIRMLETAKEPVVTSTPENEVDE